MYAAMSHCPFTHASPATAAQYYDGIITKENYHKGKTMPMEKSYIYLDQNAIIKTVRTLLYFAQNYKPTGNGANCL